jgi:hypothetical protein
MSEEALAPIRHQLVLLSRRKKARVTGASGYPCDWRPASVWCPATKAYFTEEGAWEYIANLIEGGHPMDPLILDVPPGRTAYVLLVEVDANVPLLYIKLQLGGGKIIGRSFHYSKHSKLAIAKGAIQ